MTDRVLIVTDDEVLERLLRHTFEAAEITVLTVESIEQMMALFEAQRGDLITLQSESEQVGLRRQTTHAALVLLEDPDGVAEATQAAPAAGDIPAETDAECIGIIGAGPGRDRPGGPTGRARCLSLNEITLDLNQRTVTVGDRSSCLTPVETRLLQLLIEHSPRVMPSELLMERIWSDADGDLAALAAAICSLRSAVDDAPQGKSRIQHVEGYGYRISLPKD